MSAETSKSEYSLDSEGKVETRTIGKSDVAVLALTDKIGHFNLR